MSFKARLRIPRPSPSPEGKPESSNKELKDSMWGVTNSFKILYVEPLLEGFRKDFSRARVLNVGPEDEPAMAAVAYKTPARAASLKVLKFNNKKAIASFLSVTWLWEIPIRLSAPALDSELQVVEDINLQLGGSTLSLIKYASNIITSASIDMEPVSSRLELYLHNLNHWHILLCCNPINNSLLFRLILLSRQTWKRFRLLRGGDTSSSSEAAWEKKNAKEPWITKVATSSWSVTQRNHLRMWERIWLLQSYRMQKLAIELVSVLIWEDTPTLPSVTFFQSSHRQETKGNWRTAKSQKMDTYPGNVINAWLHRRHSWIQRRGSCP